MKGKKSMDGVLFYLLALLQLCGSNTVNEIRYKSVVLRLSMGLVGGR